MKCEKCQTEIPEGAVKCPGCGVTEGLPQPDVSNSKPLSWWGKIWSQPRMARKDFWIMTLFCYGLAGITSVTVVIPLFLMVMAFVMDVHRLHDSNRSAWNMLWLLLPIIGPVIIFIFELLKGTEGPNRYGDEPQRIF